MYQRLFEWVVDRINGVMEPRDRDPRRDGKDTVIGVLDIYGFEVFPVNRWVVQPPHHTLWSPQPPGPSQSWGAWLCWGAECLAFGAVGPLPQAGSLSYATIQWLPERQDLRSLPLAEMPKSTLRRACWTLGQQVKEQPREGDAPPQ